MKHTALSKADLLQKTTRAFALILCVCTAFASAKAQDVKRTTKDTVDVAELQNEPVFYLVEENPEFVGGEDARLKFLRNNLQYPKGAIETGEEGIVTVGFIVEPDGSITNVKVVKSSGSRFLDEEAVRVCKLMPKWKAGKQRGKTVRVQYNMPITFVLEGKYKKKK